jgi:hypothetical protein
MNRFRHQRHAITYVTNDATLYSIGGKLRLWWIASGFCIFGCLRGCKAMKPQHYE